MIFSQLILPLALPRCPSFVTWSGRNLVTARQVLPFTHTTKPSAALRLLRQPRSQLQGAFVVLVYPAQANIELGRISILTPVGAALIGLSIGQSIEFKTYTGESRLLTVLHVAPP